MSAITHRTVATNGIEMHVAEAGDGPLVVLAHGFPELWYSWRHQLPALAAAGYHAVAPDQRGYGGTTRPEAVGDYDIEHLAGDLIGLLDEMGRERAVFVGHDWGAPVVWHCALRYPERVAGVMGMSVPYRPRGDAPPGEMFALIAQHMFFYIQYFQTPGVADAELATDPRRFIASFLWSISGDAPAGSFKTLPHEGTGMGDVLSDPPAQLPGWITDRDIDEFASAFERTGFTGGLNWYRNFDRNWEITADLAGARIEVPAGFVAGEKDPVLLMSPPDGMPAVIPDLRVNEIVPGAGHWIQQERPDDVNRAVLAFLDTLDLGTS